MLKIDQKSPLISVHTYSVGVQEEESVEKFMSTITDDFNTFVTWCYHIPLKFCKFEQNCPLISCEYESSLR